jgi:hypothetical protein
MAIRITYPDGSTRLLPRAVRVDQQNFHEGTYDFYDESGALLEQIDMHTSIRWQLVDEPPKHSEDVPLFLRKGSEGNRDNAQDEKDSSSE